jgi:hypothetical protein
MNQSALPLLKVNVSKSITAGLEVNSKTDQPPYQGPAFRCGFSSHGGLGRIDIKEVLLLCSDTTDYSILMAKVILIGVIMIVPYSDLFILCLFFDLFQRKIL